MIWEHNPSEVVFHIW